MRKLIVLIALGALVGILASSSVSAASDSDASPTHRDTSDDEITSTEAQADIPPPLPCYFQGTVSSLNPAGPVPEGVMVDAFVDGVKKAETAVTAQSTYELPMPGEYSDEGKTVSFEVAGVEASQTAPWISGEVNDNFDLTIDSLPGQTVTWDMPDGLDTSPPYFNVCRYEGAVEVTLADVDDTMPAGLLIWSTSMTFYKKGWGANTLTTLEPGAYYICFVPTASVWEIPQEPTPIDGIIIESLPVTANHCYLKTYSWGYKVG